MNKSFLYFVIAVLLVVIILMRTCNKKVDAVPPAVAKIERVLEKDTSVNAELRKQDEIIKYTESVVQELSDSLQRKDKLIRAANKTNTELANDLADAKIRKDTVRFINDCDSLAKAVILSEGTYREISDSSKKEISLLKQLNTRKDTAIEILKDSRIRLTAALNTAKLDLLPKRKFYGGIEAFSTPQAFQSVQVGVMMADKRGQIFGLTGGVQISGGFIGGVKYYRQF